MGGTFNLAVSNEDGTLANLIQVIENNTSIRIPKASGQELANVGKEILKLIQEIKRAKMEEFKKEAEVQFANHPYKESGKAP